MHYAVQLSHNNPDSGLPVDQTEPLLQTFLFLFVSMADLIPGAGTAWTRLVSLTVSCIIIVISRTRLTNKETD